MAIVIKFVKGVRNHWKKSTFALVALTYSVNYVKEYNEIQVLMRQYCEKAAFYGRATISPNDDLRQITVILNPNANKRKALKEFEKYCAPILYLAGVCVNVIHTESEGHAKTLMESLATTDAVIVAGGDGTLSEVITGLLRKSDDKTNLPIGILPLGKTNTMASHLFPGRQRLKKISALADASLAVVENFTKPVDVMKIQVMEDDGPGKAVYALSSIEWGAYRDAEVKKDKYWYFGPLRNYVTYLFNGYKDNLSWNCEASINYTLPCEGCRSCVTRSDEHKSRWYQRFFSYKPQKQAIIKEADPLCQEIHKKDIATLDLKLATMNTNSDRQDLPMLHLNLGPSSVDYVNFVSQGWQTAKGQNRNTSEIIEMKEVDILPVVRDTTNMFSIDKEEFEVKPVKVTLLSKAVQMFCKANSNVVAH